MTEYDYVSLRDELQTMPRWKHVAAAATSAEKVHSIVAVLALPETRRMFECCIEFSWKLVNDGAVDSSEGARLVQEIGDSPEWSCEYPDCLPFAVLHPLDLARYAVIESISESDTLNYDGGFSHMLDIASRMDTGEEPVLYAAEESSQVAIIETLRTAQHASRGLAERLRKDSDDIRSLVVESLPTYCQRFAKSLLQEH